MARLGELLVAARLLDQEQIDRALRAQVLWGGRLGTNLIELGMLDLDGISRALGRQHGVPAALARHFDKADGELQERLDAELAKQWSVVPLLHVGPHKKIAIAVLDPLPAAALDQLAAAFLCTPDRILVSVAAEMRVRYHLERVYGVARDPRFLRLKGPNVTPFPQFDNVPVPIDREEEHAVPIVVDDSAHPTGRAFTDEEPTPPPVALPTPVPPPEDADDLARLIDEAIAQATAVEETQPQPVGRERRTYVRTLADEPPASPSASQLMTPAPASLVAGSAATLGRIAIKKIASAPPEAPARATAERSHAATAKAPTPATKPPPRSFVEATRAIRRASRRDRVAELVIYTLQQFVPMCDAAIMLIVRGDVAISWKQFSRTCATAAAIAVPLDRPGLVPTVIEKNAVARCSVNDVGAIDEALMRSLGELRGDLVVVPIAVADKVVALIATATEADAEVENVELVASAASAAFARLIRDASR
jgi:hypothetical protein